MWRGFEWDEGKARGNLRKHDISFEEARTVFLDPLAMVFGDQDHSAYERREFIVGHSIRERLLFVSFTERGGKVRIISARPATRIERTDYEEGI
jgi:hypothetical protein